MVQNLSLLSLRFTHEQEFDLEKIKDQPTKIKDHTHLLNVESLGLRDEEEEEHERHHRASSVDEERACGVDDDYQIAPLSKFRQATFTTTPHHTPTVFGGCLR